MLKSSDVLLEFLAVELEGEKRLRAEGLDVAVDALIFPGEMVRVSHGVLEVVDALCVAD
jgi:hypothetical protein